MGDVRVKKVLIPLSALAFLAGGTAFSQATSDAISEADKSAMIASCAVCHGAAGEGNEARSAPRLSELGADYIERQLDLFATGKRGTAAGDSFGPQMFVIAQSLQPADRKAAASHYASSKALPPPLTLDQSVAGQRGKQAYETCAACHGEDAMGNPDIGAPRIAGQADWYLLASLEAYHSGARGYDEEDLAGQQMRMALDGVDRSEFKAIAAYVASLGRGD
jgi:cytochrome c553